MSKYRAFESETLPQDYRDSIVKMKRALRAQIGDVESLFEQVSEFIVAEIDSIKAQEALTGSAWPILEFEDIAVGKVSADQLALIKRRGCVVLRNHFLGSRFWGGTRGFWITLTAITSMQFIVVQRTSFSEAWRHRVQKFFRSIGRSRRCSCVRMSAWGPHNLF